MNNARQVTDAEVEAGARAIAQSVNSPNCIQFEDCAARQDCVCREDARLALTAARVRIPVATTTMQTVMWRGDPVHEDYIPMSIPVPVVADEGAEQQLQRLSECRKSADITNDGFLRQTIDDEIALIRRLVAERDLLLAWTEDEQRGRHKAEEDRMNARSEIERLRAERDEARYVSSRETS